MEIHIGDSPYHMNNPVCVTFDGLVPRKAEANCAKPLCGRYISVQRTSQDLNYMHVCELMAYSSKYIYTYIYGMLTKHLL